MSKPRVIVVVEGGVVQSVYGNIPTDVSVLDHDNWQDEGCDPDTKKGYGRLLDEIRQLKQVW